MNKPFFCSEQRVMALLYEAGLWMGTPWCANSAARGMGVACHLLPTEIYRAVGALGSEFPTVKGVPNRHATESVMVPFLDGRPEFERVKDFGGLQAGDLVGLRINRCVDHLGVVLQAGMFVHVLMHKRTDCDLLKIPPWFQRLGAAWRPVEQ